MWWSVRAIMQVKRWDGVDNVSGRHDAARSRVVLLASASAAGGNKGPAMWTCSVDGRVCTSVEKSVESRHLLAEESFLSPTQLNSPAPPTRILRANNNTATSRVNSHTCLRPVWITWRLDRILQNKAETDIIARSAADCVTTILLRLPQYLAVQPLRPAIPPHLRCPPHTVHNTLFRHGLHAASLDLATGLPPAHR